MTTLKRTALHVAFLAGCMATGPLAASASCPTTTAQIAMQTNDLNAVRSIYDDVRFNSECSNTLRTQMRDSLATLYLDAAKTTSGTARVERLQEALRLGRTWEYQVALGEALMQIQDYDEAAVHLQNAINRLNDNPNEGAINEPEAMRIVRLATTAIALAERPVETPLTRSGNTGGVFAPSVRGFMVRELPVHVTFEFDSVVFTQDGFRRANDLATALREQPNREITLEGHTDPLGSETYNMNLSLRRAEAVRDFLYANGFQGVINVIPRGEEVPPILDSGLVFDQEQTNTLARRVELLR